MHKKTCLFKPDIWGTVPMGTVQMETVPVRTVPMGTVFYSWIKTEAK